MGGGTALMATVAGSAAAVSTAATASGYTAIAIGAGVVANIAGADSFGVGGGDGDTCSFAPTTLVLMADGTTEAISQIKVGDKVEAADPTTGKDNGGQTVQHIWINHDTDLLDLTVNNGHGHTSVIHTTANHPFWDGTTHTWTRADHLRPHDKLASTNGQHPTVVTTKVTPGAANRWNLTVQQLHTYYVLAGITPILVHNCNENIYEAGGKHGTQARGSSRGTNSAEPADGQGALDNSVQIKPNNPAAPRRVGIDPTNGDVVILDRTGDIQCGCSEPGGINNLFHGHVRTDVNTDPGMIAAKNALRRGIKSGDITQ